MKHIFLPLFAAACGALTASALDATNARVSLVTKGSTVPKLEKISMPTFPGNNGADIFQGKHGATLTSPQWYYINVPIRVEAKARGDKDPQYVPALTVHIYAAITQGKKENPVLLDREVTYVEIPVDGKSKNGTEVNVGVFISPANACKLAGDDPKADLTGKLSALAIEATFNGSNCMHPEEDPFIVFDPSLKNKLSGHWWKKRAGDTKGAALSTISETPFAPFYSPHFPQTSPIYSAQVASDSSSSASSSVTDYTPKPAAEPDTTSTTSASTDEEATGSSTSDSSSGSSKKSSRSSRSSRRNR